MATIPQIVENLEHLTPEDLEVTSSFVQSLLEAQQRKLLTITEEVAAKLVPTLPDPPATGVWKKRSHADTDDW
ncbi:hypothetical protein [Verrucomicrobium spinosum]|uniref:hypothetical protein n=1 Tax=Verrucomicrobium spinosum TaxID=2736 RepID=UPI000174552B|nr:hypothetical protein [Verrucomicrobium spinosum]